MDDRRKFGFLVTDITANLWGCGTDRIGSSHDAMNRPGETEKNLRQERLRAALRENLKRRKGQARRRAAAENSTDRQEAMASSHRADRDGPKGE
jgi:hypothetical protein